MTSIEFQQTLASSAICAGIGVHSGERARLTLKPAPVGTGIRFHRVDVLEHLFDLRPALDLEQDFPAGAHEG